MDLSEAIPIIREMWQGHLMAKEKGIEQVDGKRTKALEIAYEVLVAVDYRPRTGIEIHGEVENTKRLLQKRQFVREGLAKRINNR